MRFEFLRRHRISLIGATLLIISAHLLFSGVRSGDPSAAPASLLMETLRPIQLGGAHLADGAAAVFRDYLDLVGVGYQNRRLRDELARLRSQQTRITELELETRRLRNLLELRDALALDAIAADVIGSDATGLARTIIISQGSSAGLKPDMAVLSNDGVVGKVIVVSSHAARVLLINDHNSAFDAFDQRTRARGIVAGLVDDGVIMKYVDRSADLAPGDAVITSGLDGIFPRGLLVGHVKRVNAEIAGPFLGVELDPTADFSHLEQVLVVTQQPPRPPDQLDASK